MLTGQHDRQDESLTGQIHNQSGHRPLTGRYFEPCHFKRDVRSRDCANWRTTNVNNSEFQRVFYCDRTEEQGKIFQTFRSPCAMVNVCAVYGCSNRSNREKDRSYFRLPAIITRPNDERRKASPKYGTSSDVAGQDS